MMTEYSLHTFNTDAFIFLNGLDLQLVDTVDVEPVGMEGHLDVFLQLRDA